MRLPNGYGSVHKLSGKRRKPWRARVTVDWSKKSDGNWTQNYYNLGYFRTRAEALDALADYNQDGNVIRVKPLTFSQVYDKWSASHFEDVSENTIRSYKSAYEALKPIYNFVLPNIKLSTLEKIMEQSGKNGPTQKNMKLIIKMVFDYAIAHDMVNKNPAEFLKITSSNPNAKKHIPFTMEEVKKLWELKSEIPLMLIYSGLRVNEFINVKNEDVDIHKQYLRVIKSKTKAGVRIVPIADKVLPFWKSRMDGQNDDFIIEFGKFKRRELGFYDHVWTPEMERVGMHHRVHDTRHTCASMLNTAGVNLTTTAMILGHAQKTLTERIYTHKEIKELLEAINKI